MIAPAFEPNAESTVLYAAQEGVAVLTLNRPQSLNSFSRQMHRDLWAALDRAEADRQIRALVITGAGRGFCAGADLSEFDLAPGPHLVERADPGPLIEQAFNPTARRLLNLRMPTVAVAMALAQRLAAMPTRALVATRHLLREGITRTLHQQLDAERDQQSALARTHDYIEGVSAFLEKRPAVFRGE
ncbi:enoyl-CoA hydratase-related protein [Polaromonas jejuensis]|uniref:Enoyl-CoA hydratase-related protein n=1 Tax=Polaromonas jejuensis TaxID=457502 RepID=A0ABW0Q766_9BURK|nr:enoyl-CoA hydratase-related protein [Polaromonas jejuensis]